MSHHASREQTSPPNPARMIFEQAIQSIAPRDIDQVRSMVAAGHALHFGRSPTNPNSSKPLISEDSGITTSDSSSRTENLSNFAQDLFNEHYRE